MIYLLPTSSEVRYVFAMVKQGRPRVVGSFRHGMLRAVMTTTAPSPCKRGKKRKEIYMLDVSQVKLRAEEKT